MTMSKRPYKDPQTRREAARYDQPIASRELLLQLLSEAQGPLDFDQLAEQLNYSEQGQITALSRRLSAMVRDGQIFMNRLSEYAIVSQADLVAGTVIGHADGFGFLKPDAGGDDLFLAPKQMKTLLHGDHALVRESGRDRRGRREGKLVEVLERGLQELSGHYYREGGLGFVVPQNKRLTQDVMVPSGEEGSAKHGDIVVVRILEYPTRRSHALGRIVEVLGSDLTPDMHVEMAIRNFALPHQWNDAVKTELADIGEELPAAEIDRRRDIRDLPLVTIDGEDARDFDDAVYCEQTDNGWRLLVAIADVSWYVDKDTALDKAAYERSTSTYFPNRVVPMLPELLSNGLCSINPQVDRFCMLCEMEISKKGKLIKTRFDEAVMRSHARLTYTEVAAILVDRDELLSKQYADVLSPLKTLFDLYKALARARRQRGAIDFETTETRFRFAEDGSVESIEPLVRNEAHKLIEECMITANIATARFLEKHHMPALYRVHNSPKEEDLDNVRQFLGELGLSLGGGESPTSKDYAVLLNEVKGRPDAHVIQTVMLRSLKQAMYEAVNEGHFGLSLDAYAHFTSPIRRYPDLLVHRAIRHVLRGGKVRDYGYSQADMEKAGQHCSTLERRADEASWDVVKALKCEYLEQHVEDEFEGIINGVNSFGLFVDLGDLDISGLVHVTTLGHDYFHHDPVHHRLVGEHTRTTFQLGGSIRVRLTRVNVDERKIDLEPVSLPKKLRSGSVRKDKSKGKIRGIRRKSRTRKK